MPGTALDVSTITRRQDWKQDMAFEITVGPPLRSISDGWTVLVCAPDGSLHGETGAEGNHGVYWRDTRLLSAWSIQANGVPWQLLNSAAIRHFAAQVFLTNQAIPLDHGRVPARTLGLAIGRMLGAGGMHEDLDLANHGPDPVRFKLGLRLESDFADIFDVKRGKLVQRGPIETHWQEQRPQLRTQYSNESFRRGLLLTVGQCGSVPF